MTSKEANVDFVNKLKRLGTLTPKQALKENKTYGQVDTFRSIQTYGERNQGIQDRVANNYGTSLFPFSRTITNSHFIQSQAAPPPPQYALIPYQLYDNQYVPVILPPPVSYIPVVQAPPSPMASIAPMTPIVLSPSPINQNNFPGPAEAELIQAPITPRSSNHSPRSPYHPPPSPSYHIPSPVVSPRSPLNAQPSPQYHHNNAHQLHTIPAQIPVPVPYLYSPRHINQPQYENNSVTQIPTLIQNEETVDLNFTNAAEGIPVKSNIEHK